MELTDKDRIRSLLQRDRHWAVYALGDLTPRMFAKCRWFTPDLALVLHDYGTCILFADGTGSIREALDHVSWPVQLQVRQDALDAIRAAATVSGTRQMLRMAWRSRALRLDKRAVRLGEEDAQAVLRLYQDGECAGESPDFFYPAMLAHGVFFGLWEADDLIAVAGTHLVAPDEGAAAIGNVYVRRDRRGRGLARSVTAAVLNELGDVETVGLNVRTDNAAAIRAYESLGFVTHCDFWEALASKRAGA